MASSITVFVVTSILFFIVGFLCGHFCQKERKMADEIVPQCAKTQGTCIYDVVQKQEQELELEENVAYGQV